MEIELNGEKRSLENPVSVSDLLVQLELGDQPVLVELNGVALKKQEHRDAAVTEGARLEIIRIVAGG